MATKKPKTNQDNITFMGQAVDPEIEKKVDGYMQSEKSNDSSESIDVSKIESVNTELADSASSAPLLPTEEIPVEVKPSAKKIPAKKIAVNHDDEEKQEVQTQAEEEANQQIEDPIDSDMINLEENEDSSDTSTDENSPEDKLDTSKTIGELSGDDSEKNESSDNEMDKAVEEIESKEDNRAKDAEEEDSVSPPLKPVSAPRKGNWIKNYWENSLYRNISIGLVLLILVSVGIYPTSRYFLLNISGVRVSASMKVLDDKTGLPLKNVEVIGGVNSSKTDGEGMVSLSKLKLGKQDIVIKKSAFAEYKKSVVLGWGSNPLGEVRLTPTGNQFGFRLSDFLSSKPILDAEVSFEDSSAKVNTKGEAILSVPSSDKTEIEVTVVANNYRQEKIKVSSSSKNMTELKMVPAKKHIYVSKRTGKYDLYSADYDGKNEKIILNASGIEKKDSLSLSPHPSLPIVAFVSSRENVKNSDGYLLSTLYIVNTDNQEVTKVTQSEKIQLIDWSGTRMVYAKITQGASRANTNRYKLISYDTKDNTEKELASTNYFNDVLSINGVIYYSPAVYQVNGKVGLYKINADGTGKKTLFDQEVWNLFRTSYDKISMSVGQDWYELTIANDGVKKASSSPSVMKSKVYVNSPDQKHSIWIDDRDGKAVMIDYEIGLKIDKVLQTSIGIKNPIIWLDSDHIMYRVATNSETADYIMSISGGQSKKINDVTDVVGMDRWYYY